MGCCAALFVWLNAVLTGTLLLFGLAPQKLDFTHTEKPTHFTLEKSDGMKTDTEYQPLCPTSPQKADDITVNPKSQQTEDIRSSHPQINRLEDSGLRIDVSSEYDIIGSEKVFTNQNTRQGKIEGSEFAPSYLPKDTLFLCVSRRREECADQSYSALEAGLTDSDVLHYSWMSEEKAAVGYYRLPSTWHILRSSSGFQDLIHLTSLYITSNNITTIDPFAFGHLAELEELHLQENDIESLRKDTFLGLQSLRRLNLSGNNIRIMDFEVFDQLQNLTELNLDGNQLSSFNWKWFRHLHNLVVLKLNKNQVKVWRGCKEPAPTEADRAQYQETKATALTAWGDGVIGYKLNVLEMRSNQLTNVEGALFDKLPLLEIVDFSDNMIKSIDPKAFRRLTNLRILLLQNNKLTIPHPEWFVALARNDQEDEDEVSVDISRNSWDCGCKILDHWEFVQSLAKEEISMELLKSMEIECSSPKKEQGRILGGNLVRKIQSKCPKWKSKSHTKVLEQEEVPAEPPTNPTAPPSPPPTQSPPTTLLDGVIVVLVLLTYVLWLCFVFGVPSLRDIANDTSYFRQIVRMMPRFRNIFHAEPFSSPRQSSRCSQNNTQPCPPGSNGYQAPNDEEQRMKENRLKDFQSSLLLSGARQSTAAGQPSERMKDTGKHCENVGTVHNALDFEKSSQCRKTGIGQELDDKTDTERGMKSTEVQEHLIDEDPHGDHQIVSVGAQTESVDTLEDDREDPDGESIIVVSEGDNESRSEEAQGSEDIEGSSQVLSFEEEVGTSELSEVPTSQIATNEAIQILPKNQSASQKAQLDQSGEGTFNSGTSLPNSSELRREESTTEKAFQRRPGATRKGQEDGKKVAGNSTKASIDVQSSDSSSTSNSDNRDEEEGS